MEPLHSIRRGKEIGLPPGTPVYTGKRKEEPVRLTVIDYDEEHFEESEINRPQECATFRDRPTVTWINVDGVHQVEVIEKVGDVFGLHPLIIEDIANTGQRPKLEEYEGCLYVVIKMFSEHEGGDGLGAEQVSLILGRNFVISFQERRGDVFEIVRERIRNAKGRIRAMGADYLLYALIDATVDGYFVTMETMGEELEEIEERLLSEPNRQHAARIHSLKRELIYLRKAIWPLREVINGLMREGTALVTEPTVPYLRDVYDHSIQMMDTVESSRDVLSGLLDIYLTSISNRMNEVMKVLTIIATLFIPLTFIAGLYGMNFRYMPELEWRWGYPAVLLVMLAIVVWMLFYFRRKGWL